MTQVSDPGPSWPSCLEWFVTRDPNFDILFFSSGRQSSPTIAFSAYLTKSLTGLGMDHTLRFDGITLNEGGGYNHYTGIFSTPKSGVYLFSFYIEDSNNHLLRAKLVVDRTTKASAVVFPYSAGIHSQAGNVVILRLIAGNGVWIAIDDSNDSIEGSPTHKVTTFSGIFLHP